jgi:hypothetical protein
MIWRSGFNTRWGFGLLFASTVFTPAAACDFCLMHQGISPLETLNGAGVRVNQRYTLLDSVFQGEHERPNPGAKEEFWTTDISGFYSPMEGLLLYANLPVRVTHGHGDVATAADGGVDLGTATGGDTGIGDASLLARYTFFRRHTLDSSLLLAVSGGLKLPTGATWGRDDNGNFLDAHTQLGTGSVDGLVGVSFNYALARVAISGGAFGSITSEGKFGDTNHQFGNSINYDLTGRYRLYPAMIGQSSTQVFASLGIDGEARERETEDGATVADSGGHTLYLSPGLQVNFAEHWTAEVSYHHAFYHSLNGTQLGEDYKIFGSLTYLF